MNKEAFLYGYLLEKQAGPELGDSFQSNIEENIRGLKGGLSSGSSGATAYSEDMPVTSPLARRTPKQIGNPEYPGTSAGETIYPFQLDQIIADKSSKDPRVQKAVSAWYNQGRGTSPYSYFRDQYGLKNIYE